MNKKYIVEAYNKNNYDSSEIDLARYFDEAYSVLIDEQKVLHIHPSYKSTLEPFLVAYKKDLYYQGIKVDFNENVEKGKAYIEEKHLNKKRELN